jgi:hemerythrin
LKRLEWSVEYEVGYDELDEQHRQIVRLANRVCQPDAHVVNIVAAIVDLMVYASTHFFTEESVMADALYPRLEEHRAAHRCFEAAMMRFTEQAATGTADIDELRHYTLEWVTNHLDSEDRDLHAFLNRQPLTRRT